MEITIKKLVMRNFKGVLGERVVEFNPAITKVYGANRTGKTTISDAFRWCLFGKNTEGDTNFGIKTKDQQGNVIPDLSHEVEVLLVVNGNEVAICRSYTEKWSKPRGVAEKVLTGHTTTYTVNGQLYTQRDFNEYINSLCSESLFMAITSPTYFVSLKADQQRSILTQMVGEVSPASIASGNKEFEALLQIMGEQDIEKYRQHLSYQMKEIKNQLERIPVRISEQQNDIAGLTPSEPVNWQQVEGDIAATQSALKRIADAIAETIADQSKAQEAQLNAQRAARQQVREEIAAKQEEMEQIKLHHAQQVNKQTAQLAADAMKYSQALQLEQGALEQAVNQFYYLSSVKDRCNQQIKQALDTKAAFIQRWNAVNEQELEFAADQFVCPTCKREFEAEDIQAKKAQLIANFNANKAMQLDAMELEAANIKQRIAGLEAEQQQAEKQQAEVKAEMEQRQVKFQQAKQCYETAYKAQQEAITVESLLAADANYITLKNETIPSLQAKLAAMPMQADATGTHEAVQGLQADQQQLQDKLVQLTNLSQVGKTIANKQQRIAQLEQEEQQLNMQLTMLEGQDYTAELLLQRTIEELEAKVNALFSFVTFTMFDHKINGALKPICECTVRGVPYSDLNNADRINAGIDIINAMCAHREVYAPCFIDNAESINDILAMKSQRIDLLVSTDKELRIEK